MWSKNTPNATVIAEDGTLFTVTDEADLIHENRLDSKVSIVMWILKRLPSTYLTPLQPTCLSYLKSGEDVVIGSPSGVVQTLNLPNQEAKTIYEVGDIGISHLAKQSLPFILKILAF